MIKQLEIKPRSQIDEDSAFALGDCGHAALASILEYYGIYISVDALARQLPYGKGYKSSTTSDVVSLGTKNGMIS